MFQLKKLLVLVLIFSLILPTFLNLVSPVYAASSPWSQTNWVGESGTNVTTSTANQVTLTATSGWCNNSYCNSSWGDRRKITFNNTDASLGVTSENLVNFPVLVKLSSSNIDYTKTQDSGQDIRFTDTDGSDLAYEIEKWDETGSSLVWVSVPQIDINSSTDYIYMYYGNASAADHQQATGVWNSNFKMVQHLKETGSGIAGEYKDSTSNANNGQGGGGTAASVPTASSSGQVDGAQSFDGVNDYVETSTITFLTSEPWTYESWQKIPTIPDSTWWAFTGETMNWPGPVYTNGYFMWQSNRLTLYKTYNVAEGAEIYSFSSVVPKVNTWFHIAIKSTQYDDTHISVSAYINGVLKQTRNDIRSDSFKFKYHGRGESRYFKGLIDESRISNSVRSAAWIAASYKSETDAFNTFASEEPQVQTSGALTSSIYDSGQRSDWGILTYAATTPANTSASVKVRTGNQSDLSDATAFSSCIAISSGSDISSNSCVADTARYIQYQLSLANTDSISTPTFTSFSQVFSLSTPTAPSSFSGSAGTTSIIWSWTDNSSDESGFYVQDTLGSTKCTVSSNTATCTETSLSPNTGYTRKVAAYNGSGNSSASSNASVITLSTAPTSSNITSPTAVSSWTNNSSFIFTNSIGFGSGNVEYFRYAWDTSSTHTWTGSETQWTSGTLTKTATSDSNSWYLHLKGYNSGNTANGTLDLGPYYYDGTVPASFDLDSPGHESYISSDRPSFKWKTAAIDDITSGLSKYVLEIDNPSLGSDQPSGDFTIDNIPTSGTADVAGNKYVIHFENFSDSNSANDYISVYTKSSSDWDSALQNDGKLREGKINWKVKAVDNAGNEASSSRTLYADFTKPTLASVSLDNIGIKDGFLVTTTTKPKITGTISDNLMPDKIILFFYKQSFFLGIETSQELALSETNTLTNTNAATSLAFSLSPSRDIEYGKYKVVVKGIDKAGNNSSEETFNIQIMTASQAKTLLASLSKEDLSKIRETSRISLPELEKKAILRREKEASELRKLTQSLSNQLAVVNKIGGNFLAAISGNIKNITANAGHAVENLNLLLANLVSSANKNIQTTASAINSTTAKFASAVSSVSVQTAITANNALASAFSAVSKTAGNIAFTTGSSLGQAYNNIAIGAPQSIRNTMLALESGATAIFNAVSNTTTSVVNAASAVNQLAVDTLDNSQENLGGKISETSKETAQIFNSQFSIFNEFSKNQISNVKNVTASAGHAVQNLNLFTANVITDINNGLTNALDKSQENIRKQIAQSHKGTTEKLIASGQAIALTWHAIIDPAKKITDPLSRVAYGAQVAFSTFQAYVFDNNPTKISDVAIENIGKNFIVISWKTNHYTNNNKVNYGVDLNYGQGTWGENWTKDHQVKITNLKPGQRYFFEVMSQNKNYVYDAYYSFETKK